MNEPMMSIASHIEKNSSYFDCTLRLPLPNFPPLDLFQIYIGALDPLPFSNSILFQMERSPRRFIINHFIRRDDESFGFFFFFFFGEQIGSICGGGPKKEGGFALCFGVSLLYSSFFF